jgi:hypothetical protein
MKSKIFLMAMLCMAVSAISAHRAVIEGDLGSLSPDTLSFNFYPVKYGFTSLGGEPQSQVTSGGKFKFIIPDISSLAYFDISSSGVTDQHENVLRLLSYLVEPGDSVHISVTRKGLQFSGKGAQKYYCRYAIDTTQISDPGAPLKSVSQ